MGKWNTICNVLLALLSLLPVSHFSLSPPATFPVSRTSCAALVAARHTLRRSRAVRRCGPLLTRTHHALCHHVMCLFDTWLSSCSEFAFSPCSSWAFTSPSCPSWAFTSLSCPPWALASLLLSSLLVSIHFSFSLLLSLGLSRHSFSLFLNSHFFLSLFLSLRFSLLLLLSLSLF